MSTLRRVISPEGLQKKSNTNDQVISIERVVTSFLQF